MAAARAAGIALAALRGERRRDPLFAEAWDAAIDRRQLRALEIELLARAIRGVAEPIFYQGEKCGERIRYNDTLGMQILKARLPEVYGGTSSRTADPRREARGERPRVREALDAVRALGEVDTLLDLVAERIRGDDRDGSPAAPTPARAAEGPASRAAEGPAGRAARPGPQPGRRMSSSRMRS